MRRKVEDLSYMKEGDPFPDFELYDQDGAVLTKESLSGFPLVIYFYPKDDTPGCTKEACEFQASVPDFEASLSGTVRVVGVSPDTVKSHRKFADKFRLGFTLLADPEHTLAEAAGVWVEKSMYGKTYMGVERTTFVLDKKGDVTKIFKKVKPEGHAKEVLAFVK